MKIIFKSTLTLSLLLCGCAEAGDQMTEERAEELAREILGGGTPAEAEQETLDGQPIWEVHVTMENGADVEVKLHAETEDLLVIEDKVGPFDYPSFTPLDGLLAFEDALQIGRTEVVGEELVAWELERESADPAEEEEYEYEFYIRDADGQLWEIKMHADDGQPTDLEPKDEVDP